MIRHFFLKCMLLITLLFCAVLYGMDMAKQGMLKMEGTETQNHSSSLLNFDIPGLSSKTTKAEEKTNTMTPTTKKLEQPKDDIESRLTKLDQIQSFNPYSAMGDKLSNGVSSIFERGIQATGSIFNHLINAIF